MPPRCSPEELRRLSELLADEKLDDVDISGIVEEPTPTSGAHGQARKKFGLFDYFRVRRAAFGDEFGVRAINPLLKETIRAENFKARAYKEASDAILGGLGITTKGPTGWVARLRGVPRETDELIAKALEQTDAFGRYTGPPQAFPAEVIKAAQNLRGWYNRYFDVAGVDPSIYINYYRPLVKARPEGLFRNPAGTPAEERFFRELRRAEDMQFYHELERTGTMQNVDPTATGGIESYVEGIARSKILKPRIEELERDVVRPHFNVRYVRDSQGKKIILVNDERGYRSWDELQHTVLGGTHPLDIALTNGLNNLLRMFGKEVDTRGSYRLIQGMTSLYYSGAMGAPFLGGRPGSILRQLGQLVPTFAEFGPYYLMRGVARLHDTAFREQLTTNGLLSSPLENAWQSVRHARSMGRAISEVSEHTLKMFSAVDQALRVVTAGAAVSRFDDALANGLRGLSGRRAIREEVERLVARGRIEEARQAYMLENVANLQYIYGKANRPSAFRGALGQAISVFTTFPLNTAELGRMYAQRAVAGDPMPLLRLSLATLALGQFGSQVLDMDLTSYTLVGAMPHTWALPSMAMHGYQAGQSTIMWKVRDVFGVGETSFAQMERLRAYNDFVRDIAPLVPGGVFFWQDVPRVISDQSLEEVLMGQIAPPLAAERDEQARQRARERAAASSRTQR